jgi:hypothetical protein
LDAPSTFLAQTIVDVRPETAGRRAAHSIGF